MGGGQAGGFRLASLLTLIDTKSTQNSNVTLLHFLAKVLWAKHRNLYDFDLELDKVFRDNQYTERACV